MLSDVDMIGYHIISSQDCFSAVSKKEIAKKIKMNFRFSGNCLVTKSRNLKFYEDMASAGSFDLFQIHGSPNYEFVHDVRRICESARIKLIAQFDPYLGDLRGFSQISELCDYILLDYPAGGTGQLIGDALLGKFPSDKLLIAGGINEANIQEKIEKFSPQGFDIQTGVEASKGIKILSKIRLIKKILDKEFPSFSLVPSGPSIYLALTDAHTSNIQNVLDCSIELVDGVHLDHSDGHFSKHFVRDSRVIAACLKKLRPNVPYDLHIFCEKQKFQDVITDYINVNDNIGTIWIQEEQFSQEKIQDLLLNINWLRILGLRVGISFQAGLSLPCDFADFVSLLIDAGVFQYSVVGTSFNKSTDEYEQAVRPMLKELAGIEKNRKVKLWIMLDREMDLEKLSRVASFGINAVSIGKRLIGSDQAGSYVRQMRAHMARY